MNVVVAAVKLHSSHHGRRSLMAPLKDVLRMSSSSTSTQQAQQHFPQIIPTNGVPIHLYADEIEPQAMAQIKLLAESPIPVDYVSGKD